MHHARFVSALSAGVLLPEPSCMPCRKFVLRNREERMWSTRVLHPTEVWLVSLFLGFMSAMGQYLAQVLVCTGRMAVLERVPGQTPWQSISTQVD